MTEQSSKGELCAPLAIGSYPRAIVHIDGDAFFASCEQSRDARLRGRPVITGSERGIASSISYEAKAMGVRRAMSMREIKRLCPDAVIMPSDYETYSILSRRFYEIVRRYTPDIEEYGIDECFADLTGLRRVYHCSYAEIAERIAADLARELGCTFSVGLAPTKVVAKIGSKWKKPSGLTAIPARDIHRFLALLGVGDVWGIGPQTTALLEKHGITTALDLALRDEVWVRRHTTRPVHQIWCELRGRPAIALDTQTKQSYQSISKTKTFTPPSRERAYLWSQLARNIESACMKARRYAQEPGEVSIFLKRQDFHVDGLRVTLSRPSAFAHEVIAAVETAFEQLYQRGVLYRATGVYLGKLTSTQERQMDLFGSHVHVTKMHNLYDAVDKVRLKYGKNTLHLGSSHRAHSQALHEGHRGAEVGRKEDLLPGETPRRRIGIPLFVGEVH